MALRGAATVVTVVVLLVACGIAAYAWANGVRAYAVESGSMSPALGTGDLVIDVPVTPTTVLQVGDVITFHPTPAVTTTHRIVAVSSVGISTKGDANPSSDLGYLQPASVVGRVAFSVPFAGYLAVLFQRPVGVVLLLVVVIGVAVAWELSSRSWRPSRRGDPSGEALESVRAVNGDER